MPVRLEYADDAFSNAWRRDWPACALGGLPPLTFPGDADSNRE